VFELKVHSGGKAGGGGSDGGWATHCGGTLLLGLKVHDAVLVVVLPERLVNTGVCGVPSHRGMPVSVSRKVTTPL
jgi:hypothetical protein